MPIRITSQILGSDVTRNLNKAYGKLARHQEKLSSGWRINRASDDPAGLVISEQLRARIASLNQEIENTSMQIARYDTADSSLMELRGILQEVRSDAVAAADGAYDDNARSALDTAAANSVEAYNRIIDEAEFNGGKLLDGGERSLATVVKLTGVDLTSPDAAAASLERIDQAMAELDTVQISIGATTKNQLETRRSNLEVTASNLVAAESEIRDADIPKEWAGFIAEQLKVKIGLALNAHANLTHQGVMGLLSNQ